MPGQPGNIRFQVLSVRNGKVVALSGSTHQGSLLRRLPNFGSGSLLVVDGLRHLPSLGGPETGVTGHLSGRRIDA